jgi:cytosine permease
MLPDYLSKAVPNPAEKRAPWYVNTAPSYAGIFLWIVFYRAMAEKTLQHGSLGICLLGLVAAGLLCYALYYYVPAMLGMKTGFPLYVVGSSTFGSTGGYLMPGLLMGLLQVGWFAVGTSLSAEFILRGLKMEHTPGTAPFIAIACLWGLVMGWIGIKGIKYVARVSLFLNAIPLVMLLIAFSQTAGTIGHFTPVAGTQNDVLAFSTMLSIVIGFFATAGAAGADFGMNSRNQTDVRCGGLVGIALAVLVTGGLALLVTAGAHGMNPGLGWDFADVIEKGIGGPLATAMYFLFTLASVTPACFCAFIAGNSFNTMIPSVPRGASTMAGVVVAVILAVTGVAMNLIGFFNIVGASFGPICGAMAADYLLAGKKWSGARQGINWAGYGAWAAGFAVGVLKPLEPAVLFSCIVGFVVYLLLAKAGLEPKPAQA